MNNTYTPTHAPRPTYATLGCVYDTGWIQQRRHVCLRAMARGRTATGRTARGRTASKPPRPRRLWRLSWRQGNMSSSALQTKSRHHHLLASTPACLHMYIYRCMRPCAYLPLHASYLSFCLPTIRKWPVYQVCVCVCGVCVLEYKIQGLWYVEEIAAGDSVMCMASRASTRRVWRHVYSSCMAARAATPLDHTPS